MPSKISWTAGPLCLSAILVSATAQAIPLGDPATPRSMTEETAARRVCKMVKVDPSCWGDLCRTKQVCYDFNATSDRATSSRR